MSPGSRGSRQSTGVELLFRFRGDQLAIGLVIQAELLPDQSVMHLVAASAKSGALSCLTIAPAYITAGFD